MGVEGLRDRVAEADAVWQWLVLLVGGATGPYRSARLRPRLPVG